MKKGDGVVFEKRPLPLFALNKLHTREEGAVGSLLADGKSPKNCSDSERLARSTPFSLATTLAAGCGGEMPQIQKRTNRSTPMISMFSSPLSGRSLTAIVVLAGIASHPCRAATLVHIITNDREYTYNSAEGDLLHPTTDVKRRGTGGAFPFNSSPPDGSNWLVHGVSFTIRTRRTVRRLFLGNGGRRARPGPLDSMPANRSSLASVNWNQGRTMLQSSVSARRRLGSTIAVPA